MAVENKRVIDFLSWLTGLVVLIYLCASVFAMITGKITYADFSTSISPIVGMLIGYWVRGSAAPAP